jgi:hypothetical protein
MIPALSQPVPRGTGKVLPFPGLDLAPGVSFDPDEGCLYIEDADGGVTIDFNPNLGDDEGKDSKHGDNLAEQLSEQVLNQIASDVLEGIEQDERSRSQWISQRERGMDLLGIKLENPRTDAASSSAPLEGMSTVRHPLLNEACLRFQANARGELLPSDGPVKVKNAGQPTSVQDEQAQQLEDDLNVFLTSTCKEYYPDTDRMLFQVGFSGAGFKKGYHCPLRRRPVLESVDAKDLIVDNTATDLMNAARVTHRISMSPATLIRMQLAGAYRDVDIGEPDEDIPQLDRKIGTLQGITKSQNTRTKETQHTIYESYCDYDIPGFEHEQDGKKTGLPLPYKIVIEKTSQKIVEIRRNWKEGDEDCIKRRVFVLYPFVPMFGFYPSGLLHILGNTTQAITAAWRIVTDSGMFANFPGFLYAKGGERQATTSFRVAPGTGAAVDAVGGDIRKQIMPLPYKEAGPAFIQFINNVAETGGRLGGTAEIQVGEGRQDAPVGTTLAMIDQAQKIISAVHKRIHAAQAEEFEILKELLSEDPEALWRHRRDGATPWNADTLKAALENSDMVPRADPNTPSQLHRQMKVAALLQRADMHPDLYDHQAVEEYALREIGIADPDRFFVKVDPNAAAAAPPPDPNLMKTQGNIAVAKMKIDAAAQDRALKQQQIAAQMQTAAADRASRENIAKLQLARELAVHPLSQSVIADQNPGLASGVGA